jgi:hypothetical protein
MKCEWVQGKTEKVCEKTATHFIIFGKSTYAACMYHYCLFYEVDIKEEAKLMKEVRV